MADRDRLERLRPIADEMLGGLHADASLPRRIREGAAERRKPRRRAAALVPALCCAALVALIGVSRLTGPGIARIETITAGDGGPGDGLPGDGGPDDGVVGGEQAGAEAAPEARVLSRAQTGIASGADITGAAEGEGASLFAALGGDMPLVAVDGRVYRMLSSPEDAPETLLGEALGTVTLFTAEPSLYGDDALYSGLSNVCAEGETVYAVSGLDARTAVICRADGALRVFQRASYAGRGPGSETLEETFAVRGHAVSATLSGVGTLTGEDAEAALSVLLTRAALVSADGTAGRQTLTVETDGGLTLQLGVSGDTLTGCGAWSCPEFFEAFSARL